MKRYGILIVLVVVIGIILSPLKTLKKLYSANNKVISDITLASLDSGKKKGSTN